jgi:hypothetical protein
MITRVPLRAACRALLVPALLLVACGGNVVVDVPLGSGTGGATGTGGGGTGGCTPCALACCGANERCCGGGCIPAAHTC